MGEGAHGIVYLAYKDDNKEKKYALKTVKVESAIQKRRFKREIKSLELIQHDNIVNIHDADIEGSLCYMCMDYIKGDSLEEHLKERKLDINETVKIVRQVAEALDNIHSKKVYHRDIKPANILLDEKGQAYITDFGIAKMMGHEESLKLTKTGAIIGTPVYLSPEQAEGEESKIDHRSDIYSLGATMYEMLTGRRVVEGESTYEVLINIVSTSIIPLKKHDESIPQMLEEICMKAVEKDSKKRYNSCKELLKDLHNFEEGYTVKVKQNMLIPSLFKREQEHKLKYFLGTLMLGAIGYNAWIYLGIQQNKEDNKKLVIKKENTIQILGEKKKAFITDFGLAKKIGAEEVTPSGQIIGTPYYLSPEQARGKQVSKQSDIYSLGASLYHMLTKSPPFNYDNRAVLIKKIANENLLPPGIREHNDHLSAALEAICMKALAKDPEKRYETMELFAEDLGRYLKNKQPLAPLVQTPMMSICIKKSKEYKFVLGSIGAFALLCGVGYNSLEEKENWARKNIALEKEVNTYENELILFQSKKKEYNKYKIMLKEIREIFNQIKQGNIDKINKKRQHHDDVLLYLASLDNRKEKISLFDFYDLSLNDQASFWNLQEEKNKNILLEKIRILKTLKEQTAIEEIKKLNMHIFSHQTIRDVDMFYTTEMYMALGDYYRNRGDRIYQQLMNTYGESVDENLENMIEYNNYKQNEFFPKVVNMLIKNKPSLGQDFRDLITFFSESVMKWIEDDTYQIWKIEEKIVKTIGNNQNYSTSLLHNFFMYSLSKSIYQRALGNWENMLRKQNRSPLLFAKYFDALEGVVVTRSYPDNNNRNDLIYWGEIYSSEHQLTEEELQQTYRMLNILNERVFNTDDGQWIVNLTNTYVTSSQNTSAQLINTIHHYLISVDEKEEIEEQYKNLFSRMFEYGESDEKALFLYQSLWYCEHKKLYRRTANIMKQKKVGLYLNDVVKKPSSEYTPHLFDIYLSYMRSAQQSNNKALMEHSLELAEKVMEHKLEAYQRIGMESHLDVLVKYVEFVADKIGNDKLVQKSKNYLK